MLHSSVIAFGMQEKSEYCTQKEREGLRGT